MEIDMVLRKANKIYLGWTAVSLATIGIGFYATRFPTWKKVLFTIGTTVPTGGCVSWFYILKTFSDYELTYLLVGLDTEYPEIKKARKK